MQNRSDIIEEKSSQAGSQFKRVGLRIAGYLLAGFLAAIFLGQGHKIEIWSNDRAFSKVDVGTTREQVVELLGKPPIVFAELDGQHTYRYRVSPWIIEAPFYRTNWYFTFDQGRLIGKRRSDRGC